MKLVNTTGLNPVAYRLAGSSPALPTNVATPACRPFGFKVVMTAGEAALIRYMFWKVGLEAAIL